MQHMYGLGIATPQDALVAINSLKIILEFTLHYYVKGTKNWDHNKGKTPQLILITLIQNRSVTLAAPGPVSQAVLSMLLTPYSRS